MCHRVGKGPVFLFHCGVAGGADHELAQAAVGVGCGPDLGAFKAELGVVVGHDGRAGDGEEVCDVEQAGRGIGNGGTLAGACEGEPMIPSVAVTATTRPVSGVGFRERTRGGRGSSVMSGWALRAASSCSWKVRSAAAACRAALACFWLTGSWVGAKVRSHVCGVGF